MATSISVAQALAYENDPSTIPAGAVFNIVDIAANIETLSATDISNFASLLSVKSMTATDAPVTFTPGGAEQAALKSAGIHITAEINAQEVIQLDTQHNMSGSPLLVPPDEHVIVLDTAANLELLTPKQLSDLGTAVEKLNTSGTNTGNAAVTQIAGTDAPPVFSDAQVNALTNVGSNGVLIVAPPNDPSQNDGTTIITGRGATFDIVWDSSVASAPDAFKTDVEQVFQFFADTYSSPVTLYYHVGYGEFDGSAIGNGFLGRSEYFNFPQESYSSIVSQLTANATSQAQRDAIASLPSNNPVGTLFVPGAEARVLGFADAPTTSEASPDGFIGFATDTEQTWNYSADPNQTPVSGEEDFLASVEHEVTEILGRGSYLADQPIDYSVMDLFRFSGAGSRALQPTDNPSYFSIDSGATNLGDWNNRTAGDSGDLGDWSGTTVGSVVIHTPNAFDDNSNGDIVNPFTANDATLMNVLGYNFTSAPVSPIVLSSGDITLSAGQLLEDLTLNQIDPGSVNAPAGDSYVVIDSAFDIESLTAAEITQALAIGVGEFIVTGGAIAFLQGNDPADNQVAALGTTPFLDVLTVAQALAAEANPPSSIPANEKVMIVDTAANIETLTASDISALSSIGVTTITATDAPVTFTPGGPEQAALDGANISITAEINVATALYLESPASGPTLLVPPTEHISLIDTAANLEALTVNQLSSLNVIADNLNANGNDTGISALTHISASDVAPVFSAAQMKALGQDHIAVVAPPNDPAQNDGTATITGRGTTFVITWDSSVASAPTEFKTDVEQVFQFYADTYSSPVTLYYNVGFGERNNVALKSGELGESSFSDNVPVSYADLVAQLTADANSGHASAAQLLALQSLPASDPTGGLGFFLTPAEAQVLGLANAPTSSSAHHDGAIGFSDTANWNYSEDPNQTPVSGETDFLGTVEHELSEVLGRFSILDRSSGGTGEASLIDLYRYTDFDTRALAANIDPSYVSIDDGATNLGDWNTVPANGDLADWLGTTVNGSIVHTPDSFNNSSNSGIINPFTASDATLMNVLGYDFTSAPASPIPLPSTDITLSAGQLLEYLTLDQIDPGSVAPSTGESYVVIDTAFALESITGPEIAQAISIGVSEFIADGAIALLQKSHSADDQVAALGTTAFVSVLTASEALAAAANPPSVPTGEVMSTVIVADTAANVEALTPTQLLGLGAISTHIVVSDLSGVGPLMLEDGYDYSIAGAVSSGETITFAATNTTLTFTDTADMHGTIDGFDSTDKFRLKDVTFDPHGRPNLAAGNVLDVTENGTTYALQLDPSQDFTGEFFHLTADSRGGTDITENNTPCYCRGTRIATPRGEQRVEQLRIGDRVMTRSGVARPIKWIGRRSFAGRFILGRKDILPVCIKAGALGDAIPRRDLWISPHHAMFFADMFFADVFFAEDGASGALIEARDLVNGKSIVQAEHADKVEYFHIELETHDVIIAEGALSETFIDDDSRGMFHNAQEFHTLYPQPRLAPQQYCAPRLQDGYEVDAVRCRIALRTELLRSVDLRGDDVAPRPLQVAV